MDYNVLTRLAPRRGVLQQVAGPVGAALGAYVWKSHPILGLISGYTALQGGADVLTREKKLDEVAQSMGMNALGASACLAMPASPILGYIGGRLAGKVLLPRVIGEAKKTSAFFQHRVGGKDGFPVWQLAVGGTALLGIGLGLHTKAGEKIKDVWAAWRSE